MADVDPFKVHDIQVNESTVFGSNGLPKRVLVLRYSVGVHGPFTITYDPASEGTPERMRQDIDSEVGALRKLESFYGTA